MKTLLTIATFITTCLAQANGTFSMIEINPQHGSETYIWADSSKNIYGAGELNGFTELNGRLYFSARNTFDNDELWSTDGTQNGLTLVKEINPTGNGYIGNLVKLGNRILFMASDNGTDFDLWCSDGTANGTGKVAEMHQTWNGALAPQNISISGNRIIFCSETQLMITDGTTAGTDSLKAITQYAQGFGYCELNNKVYFLLPNASWQQEIWSTDGTVMGTQKMLNLPASLLNITSVSEMVSFNGKIYLVASSSGEGNDLFAFDGHVNGQLQKISLSQTGNSYPSQLTLFNGALYFTASTATSANVFRIASNNSIVQELVQNANFSWLSSVTFSNNSVYFLGENQQQIHRVELNTLLHTTTTLNGYIIPSYIWNNSGMLVGSAGKVFFAAYDSITNNQVFFVSDEALNNMTAVQPEGANTFHPFNVILSCGMADVFDFKMWGDKVIVPANFNSAGRELWIFDAGVASGVEHLKKENEFSIFPNPVQNELFVKTNNTGYCEEQLFITNVLGEVVSQISFAGGSTFVNLSGFVVGSYCATISEILWERKNL
ncbi:MAG: hypothetical protein V4615_09145 [Bacteroidota bacterium]